MSDLITPSGAAVVEETMSRPVDEALARELVERARAKASSWLGPVDC